MLLADRVVLLAGAGPGLGSALAERLVAHGARVVLAARSVDPLRVLAEQLGDVALAVPTDLRDPSAVAALVAVAVERFGSLDGLVHNAAVVPPLDPVLESGDADLEEALALGTSGPLTLVRSAVPHLPRGGSIVFVGSAVVRHPKPGFGAYNVGKHAMLGLARSLALELGPSGIRVNTLAAGKIDGERLQRYFEELATGRSVGVDQVRAEYAARIALRRLPRPEEHADAVVFLLSDLASAVTGHVLDTNGGEYFD